MRLNPSPGGRPTSLREEQHSGSTLRAWPGIRDNGELALFVPAGAFGGLDGTDDQGVETVPVQGVVIGGEVMKKESPMRKK